MNEKWRDGLRDHVINLRSDQTDRPLLVGVYGPQGSGKTTLSEQLCVTLRNSGLSSLAISLDDFYLAKAARVHLSKTVHPLLQVRGVPGTHDVALAYQVFDDLLAGRDTLVPRFDKSVDDVASKQAWISVAEPLDVVIFEGWCVGVPDILRDDCQRSLQPLNRVEREQDAEGVWRSYVAGQNSAYQELYQRIQFMIGLRIPDFSFVSQWRWQQECAMYENTGKRYFTSLGEVQDFVALFERVTRVAQDHIEDFTDCVIDVGEAHAWLGVHYA